MNTSSSHRWFLGISLVLALIGPGCDADTSPRGDNATKETTKTVETKKTALGKNVFLEVQGDQRRVIVSAEVCLREGNLEGLLCRKGTKEHEYLLSADCDARDIHKALEVARAKAGSPVKFEPRFQPATGSIIKITVQYEDKGKLVTLPARQWIRSSKDKKALESDWVFGGSQLVPNPTDKNKPPIYLANYGDIICVCNLEDAMLDLPIRSLKTAPELRTYEAHTDRIPASGTKVNLILEAVPEKEKK
ncbi:MAG: YdjY domain-containing protein [Gemmataceae bacterium]|nr:YdjY domain-containing protein [Gemmataceae bacterium]